jgi:hypothetical protein
VLDHRNAPVQDAIVSAYNIDMGNFDTRSDSAGDFLIDGLGPGQFRVSAKKEHFNEAVLEKIRAGTGRLFLVLQPLSSASGAVVDEAGNALKQFAVVYLNTIPPEQKYWEETARAEKTAWVPFEDEKGRFRLEDITSNVSFAVGARADGYQPAFVRVEPVAPGAVAENVEIRLLVEARVEGRVVSPDGTPVSAAAVHMGDDVESSTPVAISASDGTYSVGGLGDEQITLTAVHPDYLPGYAPVSPARGRTVNADIIMGQGAVVDGTIYKGANPVPGQTITVSRILKPRYRREVSTDERGHYTVEGIPPGEVEVYLKSEDVPGGRTLRFQRTAVVEPGTTTTVDFNLPAAYCAIQGSVSINGQPAANARVKATVTSPAGDTVIGTRSLDDGSFIVENLPPGTAWLEVSSITETDVELSKTIQLTIKEGEHLYQDVSFDSSSSISGAVSNLKPGQGCEVIVFRGNVDVDLADATALLELDPLRAGRAAVGPDGGFEFNNLEPGPYTVAAFVMPNGDEDSGDALAGVRVTTQSVNLGTGPLVVNIAAKD